MSPRKVISLARALSVSQLRASRSGRSGASLFQRYEVMLVIDAAVFVVAALAGSGVQSLVGSLGQPFRSQFLLALKEGLVFIPALIPSMVLIAGVIFELSTSSRFASSDAVNWLPVTQSEYVAASILSVSYVYSVMPAVFLGATLIPAAESGYLGTWFAVSALSALSLLLGGTLVEILRGAINRVSSTMMKRARRGALILRLVVTVVIILVFQVIFNFVILVEVLNAFTSALPVTRVIPIFWGSISAQAVMNGDALGASAYSFGTLLFVLGLVWVAARVRSTYWSPSTVSVSVTASEYAPKAGALSKLGLNAVEAAVVRKDLRGLARRRELLPYFAIPIVLAAVLYIESSFAMPASGSQASGAAIEIPVWAIGGLFALIISSISFGQEGKSIMGLYSFPIGPREILRAKAFTALLFSMTAMAGMFLLLSLVAKVTWAQFLENLAIAVSVAAEETFIGLGFGARYPDFQERPRPRFVDPIGMILMMVVGMIVALVTALPVLVEGIVRSLPGMDFPYGYLPLAALAFAAAVSALAYRWARRETAGLFSQYRG